MTNGRGDTGSDDGAPPTGHRLFDYPLAWRLARIGGAAAIMVAVMLVLGAVRAPHRGDRGGAWPGTAGGRAEARSRPPARNAEEADVFRLRPGATTLAMDAERRPGAKTRDLASYHRLRAYPGAPPAIPHDVDPAWLRTQMCNTCHARGGWVPGQNAYAPVTPHPQYANCMQCHVDGADGDLFVANDFQPAEWPALDRQALTWWSAHGDSTATSPPPIPHGLQLRGNCLACHAGPAAVAEIRTPHPQRSSCRQCHAARSDLGAARGETADDGAPDGAFSREVR